MAQRRHAIFFFLGVVFIAHVHTLSSPMWPAVFLSVFVLVVELLLSCSKLYSLVLKVIGFIHALVAERLVREQLIEQSAPLSKSRLFKEPPVVSETLEETQSISDELGSQPATTKLVYCPKVVFDDVQGKTTDPPESVKTNSILVPTAKCAAAARVDVIAKAKTTTTFTPTATSDWSPMHDVVTQFVLDKITGFDVSRRDSAKVEPIPSTQQSATTSCVRSSIRPHHRPTSHLTNPHNASEEIAFSEAERSAQVAEKELLDLLDAEEHSKCSSCKTQKPATLKVNTAAKRTKAKKEKLPLKNDLASHEMPFPSTQTPNQVQQLKSGKVSQRPRGNVGIHKKVEPRSACFDKDSSRATEQIIDVRRAVADSNSLNGNHTPEETSSSSPSQSQELRWSSSSSQNEDVPESPHDACSSSSAASTDGKLTSNTSLSNNSSAHDTPNDGKDATTTGKTENKHHQRKSNSRSTSSEEEGSNERRCGHTVMTQEELHAEPVMWKASIGSDSSQQSNLARINLVPNAKTRSNLEVNEKKKKRLKNLAAQSESALSQRPSTESMLATELRARFPEAAIYQDEALPVIHHSCETCDSANDGWTETNDSQALHCRTDQRNRNDESQFDRVEDGLSREGWTGSMLAAELRAKFPDATVLSCGAALAQDGSASENERRLELGSSVPPSSWSLSGAVMVESSVLAAELRSKFPGATIQDVERTREDGGACCGLAAGSALAAELAAHFPGATIHVGLPVSSMAGDGSCLMDDGPSDYRSSSSRTSSTMEPTLSVSSACDSSSSLSSQSQYLSDAGHNQNMSSAFSEVLRDEPCSSHLWIDSAAVSNWCTSQDALGNAKMASTSSASVRHLPVEAPSVAEASSRGAQWRAELQRRGEQQLSQVQEDLRKQGIHQSMPGMANLEALSKGAQRRVELQRRGEQQLREVEEELQYRYGSEGWSWGGSSQPHKDYGLDPIGEQHDRSFLRGLQTVSGAQFTEHKLDDNKLRHCESVDGPANEQCNARPFHDVRSVRGTPLVAQQEDDFEERALGHQLGEGKESLLQGLKSVKGSSFLDSKDRSSSSTSEALKPTRLVELAKELSIERSSMTMNGLSRNEGEDRAASVGLAALMGPSLVEAWTSHNENQYPPDLSSAVRWETADCPIAQCNITECPVLTEYWQAFNCDMQFPYLHESEGFDMPLFQSSHVAPYVAENNEFTVENANDDVVQIVEYQVACPETRPFQGLVVSAEELQAAVPDHYED